MRPLQHPILVALHPSAKGDGVCCSDLHLHDGIRRGLAAAAKSPSSVLGRATPGQICRRRRKVCRMMISPETMPRGPRAQTALVAVAASSCAGAAGCRGWRWFSAVNGIRADAPAAACWRGCCGSFHAGGDLPGMAVAAEAVILRNEKADRYFDPPTFVDSDGFVPDAVAGDYRLLGCGVGNDKYASRQWRGRPSAQVIRCQHVSVPCQSRASMPSECGDQTDELMCASRFI